MMSVVVYLICLLLAGWYCKKKAPKNVTLFWVLSIVGAWLAFLLVGMLFEIVHGSFYFYIYILYTPFTLLAPLLILMIVLFVKRRSAKTGYYPAYYVLSIIAFLVAGTGIALLVILPEPYGERIPLGIAAGVVTGLLSGFLYFLPYRIAFKKNHAQTKAIFILNIFAGWTFFAWLGALIWACIEPKTPTYVQPEMPTSNADELKKYSNLLASGVITQEEFDMKKKQLLGL